jgi:phosphate acetyltransferase
MDVLRHLIERAQSVRKRILLPESGDLRTLQAARAIADQGIASVALLGDAAEVRGNAAKAGLDLSDLPVINPAGYPQFESFAETLYELRQAKGLTRPQAAELLHNPLYFGTMMVYRGEMDGMVAGAINTTGDVLRPALQIIKTGRGFKSVSGAFLISVPDCALGADGLFVFADCAVNINPDAATLAEIGVQAAHTAKNLIGLDPVVAFLSFSTKGSAKHELADKVIEAVRIARELDPSLPIDGELQADAALIEAVGRQKAPGSPVAGQANVLVFPDLQSGNIGYKLVERLAGAAAVGPVLQGLAKPVNDLSRGCQPSDIVNMAAITALQAVQAG